MGYPIDAVTAPISNFIEEDPFIRFRPWVRAKSLTHSSYERHVQFIRALNLPPLTPEQQAQCAREFEAGAEAKATFAANIPAICASSVQQADCFINAQNQYCCIKPITVDDPEPRLYCPCTPVAADPSRSCCQTISGEDCTYRSLVQNQTVPSECIAPVFSPSAICSRGQDSSQDPPNAPNKPDLW